MKRSILFLLCMLMGFTAAEASGKERKAELLKFALSSVNKEEFAVAEQTLNKLLEIDADNVDALFLRAYCYYMEGEYDKAMPDLDKAIQLDPAYTNAYLIRGRTNRALGNYWSALRDYNKARKLDPHLTFFSVTKNMIGSN